MPVDLDSGAPSVVDGGVMQNDMAYAPFDLARNPPDLWLPPGPRFLSEPSTDVVAVADHDTAGGDTLLAYGPTGNATTVAYSAARLSSAQTWPNQLIAAYPMGGGLTMVWWPSVGAGGPLQVYAMIASADGLYLAAYVDASYLSVGPRDSLEALPAKCITPKFAPATDHLYVLCGSDLFRVGKDQPAASAIRVAPGIAHWWFSSDGTRIIVDTTPLTFASTALNTLDAVTLMGSRSPDNDLIHFQTVTPIPGRTVVEYVAYWASGAEARELDLSTGMVRPRTEVDYSVVGWFGAASIPLAATSSWFAYERVDGIQMFPSPYDWVFQVCLDSIDGSRVHCAGSGEARAPLLLASGAALFGAYVPPGVYAWDLFGPDLVERASTMSQHGRRAVPLDDDHFLVLDADFGSSGPLETCGATGCVDTLANPIVDDFRYEPSGRLLYYIQNGVVLVTTL
ncbi:MAG: hypothetical protein JWM53_4382 [bacterium]|nr:hypothetical protein [bacterium]